MKEMQPTVKIIYSKYFFTVSYLCVSILRLKYGDLFRLRPVYIMLDSFGTRTKRVLVCLAFTRDHPNPNSLEICPESVSGLGLYWIRVDSWNRSHFVPDRLKAGLSNSAHMQTCRKGASPVPCERGQDQDPFKTGTM